MAYNTNSEFKIPLVSPSQQSQSETLLFSDILKEKTLALHDSLYEFLQVYSYHKFDIEFSNFLKHIKHMIQEGQRAGLNMSRITNSSHLVSMYSRPSILKSRSPTFSMINSTHNSTFQLPENNFQHIESLNPLKLPDNINFQPRVVLPRLEQLNHTYCGSPTLNATVTEVNQCTNETAKIRNDKQSPEHKKKPQSIVPNSYSGVTMIKNKSVIHSQRDEDVGDGDIVIESPSDNIEFKIIVSLPDSNTSDQHNNQLYLMKNFEKYLFMWTITMRPINSKSKSLTVILSGTLLGDDKFTVLENCHDAGILEKRKENNFVQTENGLYHLIGNLVGDGPPNEFYNACLAINGIPRRWKCILKQLTEKTTKKAILNFSLDSTLGPIKSTKTNVNHKTNMMIKKKSIHTKSMDFLTDQQISGKRNNPEYNKTKINQFIEQLPPLMTSTPKRPKKQLAMFKTPSHILKNKLHKNIYNKVDLKSQNHTLKTINDSINVTKKRLSDSKKWSKEFLKLSSNNNTPQKENIANFALLSEKINKEKRKKLTTEKVVEEKIKNLKTTVKKNKQENTIKNKVVKKCSNKRLVVQGTDLFDCLETSDDDGKSYNYNIMESPGKISFVSHADKSRSKTSPMFNRQVNTMTTRSLIISEPPTPLSKSREAKALKRIKAPKITLKEEIKNNRMNNKKRRLDYKAACQNINDMLEHGNIFNEDCD